MWKCSALQVLEIWHWLPQQSYVTSLSCGVGLTSRDLVFWKFCIMWDIKLRLVFTVQFLQRYSQIHSEILFPLEMLSVPASYWMQSDSFVWASIPIRGLVWVTCDVFPPKLNDTSVHKQMQRGESPIPIKSWSLFLFLKLHVYIYSRWKAK